MTLSLSWPYALTSSSTTLAWLPTPLDDSAICLLTSGGIGKDAWCVVGRNSRAPKPYMFRGPCQVHGTLIAIGDIHNSIGGLHTILSSTAFSSKLISDFWRANNWGLCGWLQVQLRFLGGKLRLGIGDGGVVGFAFKCPTLNGLASLCLGIGIFVVQILLVWLWCGQHFEFRELLTTIAYRLTRLQHFVYDMCERLKIIVTNRIVHYVEEV